VDVNEWMILRSLGMEDLVQHYCRHDSTAAQQARELFEVLMGGIYQWEEPDMQELAQMEQALDLPKDWCNPDVRAALAHVINGRAHTRRSALKNLTPPEHWEWAGIRRFKPYGNADEGRLRRELGICLRDALWLHPDASGWRLMSETADGNGGRVVILCHRNEEDPTHIDLEVELVKRLKKFELRSFVEAPATAEAV